MPDLAAQGLLNKPHRRASLEDIPATISRMSLLQIDTINKRPDKHQQYNLPKSTAVFGEFDHHA
ncbi:hypothetical protein O5964_29750, partial [Escherichia coli]|nr:hypothetical protein [Escherichia coli]